MGEDNAAPLLPIDVVVDWYSGNGDGDGGGGSGDDIMVNGVFVIWYDATWGIGIYRYINHNWV